MANLDYKIPRLCFEKGFGTYYPARETWDNGGVLENEVAHFFTDGSKLDGRVGAGVFCDDLGVNLSFRLHDHCSVYQAEVLAVDEVLTWLRHNVICLVNINIYVDSQAAIRSLESVSLSSGVALNCHSSLNEMTEHFNIRLVWVPGHSDVKGNCRADELARHGTTLQLLPERECVGRPSQS